MSEQERPVPKKPLSSIESTLNFVLSQLKARKYRRRRLIEQLTSARDDMEDYKEYLKELITYYEQDGVKTDNEK